MARLSGSAGAIALSALLLSAGAARAAAPPPAGSEYVAMGSSFAAGPGIPPPADNPPTRCGRSGENYAHQLAREHGLMLKDVSCGGATTKDLLAPWRELPPQLDAVDARTRLVTITIGGNDLGYIGGIAGDACRNVHAGDPGAACPAPAAAPTDQDYADAEARMRQVVAEVRRRAPQAQVVFVDYITLLPPQGTCPATSLTPAEADGYRMLARRLAEITARAAKDSGSALLAASDLTRGRDICAQDPWANGYPRPGAPIAGAAFHPKLEAMTAIAGALDRMIWPTAR